MILAYRQAEIPDFPLLTAMVEDVNDRHQESVIVRNRTWERLYYVVIDAHGVRLELANERQVGVSVVVVCPSCKHPVDDAPGRVGIGTGCPTCGWLSDLPDFVEAC